jgi:hypothetical protein
MPSWTENVKKNSLSNGLNRRKATKLLAELTWTQVPAQQGAQSGICGCTCGTTKRCSCEWEGLRVDVQRPFSLGATQWVSLAIQQGGGTFASMCVQSGVNFSTAPNVENLVNRFLESFDGGVRVYVGNADGQNAYNQGRS